MKFIFDETVLIMKQIILPILSFLFIAANAFAQEPTQKVVLTKGQKVKMTTEMKSNKTQAKQGEMKTDLLMVTELEVTELTDKGYKMNITMTKAKMKFESSFFTGEYDSEDDAKKKGQMAKGFEQVMNKPEAILLGFDGKVIKDPAKEDKMDMMKRMMGGGDAATAAQGAFLIMPKDIEIGKKWRTTSEEDGLKVITEYTYKGMMGNMANLTANQQTKGEVSGGRGGQFTSKINNLTQMTIMVDANTGLITMKTINTKDNSETEMGGETYKSTGTTNTTVTCN